MNSQIIATGNDFRVGSLDFFQIYWEEEQKKHFFEWSTPLYNPVLTVFFENSPICHAVLASNAEKISVCSWALRHKYKKFSIPPQRDLTEEILYSEFDILSFTRNSPNHQMLAAMDEWHKGSKRVLQLICDLVGVKFPKECKYPIYQNAFCAKGEIYKEYVNKALVPAMEVMESDGALNKLCWQDSGYYRLQNPKDYYRDRVKKFLGVDFAPMFPFLLERFFSCWINDKGFNVQYL